MTSLRGRLRGRSTSRGRRVLLVLATAALGVSLIGMVSHYRDPGSLYTLALAAFAPQLGLFAVIAVVLFAATRSVLGWVGLAASLAVVAWLVVVQAPNYIATTASGSGPTVVVMTANLKLGAADPHAVVAAVRARHVGVLMLEEVTPTEAAALQQVGLDSVLPHSYGAFRPEAAGTGIWSRFPLTHTEVHNDLGFALVTARCTIDGRSVGLVALHANGPSPSIQFPKWQYDLGVMPRILQRLPDRDALVGGDFNSTLDTVQFRAVLGHRFADAAEQAGAGFTPTWPADQWFPPQIAIDHVLTRGGVATSADSVTIAGSDHRALVVSVRFGDRGDS